MCASRGLVLRVASSRVGVASRAGAGRQQERRAVITHAKCRVTARSASTLCWRNSSQLMGLPVIRKPLVSVSNRTRSPRLQTVAMVNVDLGPSTILGTSLVLASLSLWQVRSAKPEISRDIDVVFSSMGVVVGGILVFQGWRLDPLLLFGQLLTITAAVSFAAETLSLRSETSQREADLLDDEFERGPRQASSRPLPPPRSTFAESWNDKFDSDVGMDDRYTPVSSNPMQRRGGAGMVPPEAREGRGGRAEPRSARDGGWEKREGGGRRGGKVDMLDDWDN